MNPPSLDSMVGVLLDLSSFESAIPTVDVNKLFAEGTYPLDYASLRDSYVSQYRQRLEAQGQAVDEDLALDSWYCSEEFSNLLVNHFHRAKTAAIHGNEGV